MSFWGFLTHNYLAVFMANIITLYTVHTLLDIKNKKTRRLLLSYPLFIGMLCLVGTLITYPEVQRYGKYSAKLFVVVTSLRLSMNILYCMYFFGSKYIKQIFLGIMIATAIERIRDSIGIFMLYSERLSINTTLLNIMLIILLSALVIICIYLTSKTKIIIYFRELLKMGNIAVFITLLYLVFYLGFEYHSLNSGTYVQGAPVGAVIYLIVLIGMGMILREQFNKKRLQQSEMLLLQHQLYVNRLENIQQELRLFQHDYKNIVAGLYASADEGNTQAVKEYIDSKILNIGEDVQNDIRQTNQFVKITNMELKGLLLVKLMEAKEAEVVIDLEVLYEVKEIAIDTSDLMRIMGILLDNAIEEAQTTVMKKVSVVILQEDKKTTIMVKNDISSNVDMSNIWKNGYSTKGKNRGLGLSSYQKILNNYDNAFCETKIENGQFMQILVVS
jgi:Histidine kinase-, DNA gyrase B-, and HSP90-like ATPase.